ncbi:WD40 repeat-like protein [Hesseltinella vesiculosa]|uniref:WD40 repeat-like protein n=1 Tax=Hesseltinella vesiculosa TaxID=101127 RepID=A0A1X2GWJ7_9FUNG|nr:WD40 repeat-like protein [Hesseltinella vesiculosa]
MAHKLPFTNLVHHPKDPLLVLSNGSHFLVVNTSTGQVEKEYPQEQPTKFQELHRLLAFNADGSQLVTTGENKLLQVYDTKTWDLVLTRPVNKRAIAVTFTNDGSTMIVADKFGDAFCHPNVASTKDDLEPILGHVSMVTDLALSDDEKYIITSDRDEHVRVSHYPNGYNIESFCLGHTDAVTNVHLVPWQKDRLVSTGGDCTLRLWDFVKGSQQQCIDVAQYIQSFVPKENPSTEAPIVQSVKFNTDAKLVALSFTKLPVILLFSWENDQFEYKQTLEVGQPVLGLDFDLEGRLWVAVAPTDATGSLVLLFNQVDAKYQLDESSSLVAAINAARVEQVDTLPDLFALFKLRKFTDLDEEQRVDPSIKKRKTE